GCVVTTAGWVVTEPLVQHLDCPQQPLQAEVHRSPRYPIRHCRSQVAQRRFRDYCPKNFLRGFWCCLWVAELGSGQEVSFRGYKTEPGSSSWFQRLPPPPEDFH